MTVKTIRRKQELLRAVIACAVVAVAAPNVANASIRWNMDSGNNGNCTTTPGWNSYGNTRTCTGYDDDTGTQVGPSATLSAWGTTEPGATNTQWAPAALMDYGSTSGIGIVNADQGYDPGEGTAPEHAADNNDRDESFFFSFGGDLVKLSSIEIGWAQEWTSSFSDTRADITVLAYTDTDEASIDGKTIADLEADDSWVLVGQYGNVDDYSTFSLGANSVYATSWLIAPSFGFDGTDPDYKFDAFKLESVKGDIKSPPVNKVPVPGTILLVGLGLGLMRVMRRA